MEPNNKFIELRKRLGPTQEEFAGKLGISRSTIADIERGSIGISKRVKSKILDKFPDEVGYFEDEKRLKSVEMKKGVEIGWRLGFEGVKRSYIYKFADFIKNIHPEYYRFSKDLILILSIGEITDELNDTTLADFIFHSTDSQMKDKSYNEFKAKGLEKYKEAFKHEEIIHKFAEACREFATSLNKIKEEIRLDYDFEDYLE